MAVSYQRWVSKPPTIHLSLEVVTKKSEINSYQNWHPPIDILYSHVFSWDNTNPRYFIPPSTSGGAGGSRVSLGLGLAPQKTEYKNQENQ